MVEPLPTPTDDAPADEIEEFAAVRLFPASARAARRDLTGHGAGAATVAQICRELDGLPLAIELAAARAKSLSLEEIAARLDDRFRFLRAWRRLADPRHQTLRATIDWSHELLSEDERALLARLSVFVGGFTLRAVAAVCVGRDEASALRAPRAARRVVARRRRDPGGGRRAIGSSRRSASTRRSGSTSRAQPRKSAVGTPTTSSRSRGRRALTTCGSHLRSRRRALRYSTPSATTCTPR